MILKDSFTLLSFIVDVLSFSLLKLKKNVGNKHHSYQICTLMTLDLKMWHALRVHICSVCFANILGVLYWLFYRRIWINSCLGVMNSIALFSFCTHLTFDLILRLRRISRLGIYPYGCWHTSRNTILAWMPHSTQFCHQKIFVMEWTAK